MSATAEASGQKVEQSAPAKKQIFLDQSYFKAFLNGVKEAADYASVEDEDIPLILEVLKKEFGGGLPRSRVKGAIFKD